MPGLRCLPVPSTEPEPVSAPRRRGAPAGTGTGGRTADVGPGQGVLVMPLTAPTGSRRRVDRWLDPLVAPRPTADADLPDPGGTCAALAAAVVEVLSGHRPAAQLVRWLSLDVHTALVRRAALAARLRSDARGHRPGRRAGRRAVVRRLRVCRPADGVVEAAAVVVDGDRVRAVAVRLEGWDGRWRATAVEVG